MFHGHVIAQFDEILLKLAEKEIGFSLGLSEGISFGFFSINNKYIRKKILDLTSKNNKFPEGFGRGFGREFPMYHDNAERKVVQELLKRNKSFASGFADGFSYNYGDSQLFNKKILKQFLDFTGRNEYCLQGLADSIIPYFKHINKSMQKELLKIPILAHTLEKSKYQVIEP